MCGCVEEPANSSRFLLPGAMPAQLWCISHRHLSTLQVRPLPEGKAVHLASVGHTEATTLRLVQCESEFHPTDKRLISNWQLWLFPPTAPHLFSSPISFTVVVNYRVPVLLSGIYFPLFCMKVVDNTVCVSPWRFGTSENGSVKGFGGNPYCFE